MAKYCAHCGKQISDKAVFCRYCGEKVDARDEVIGVKVSKPTNTQLDIDDIDEWFADDTMPKKETSRYESNQKMPKKMTTVIVVALALVIVTAVVGVIMYFGKSNDTDTTGKTETEESFQDESENNQTQAIESKGEGSGSNDTYNSDYLVGEMYTVQTNLRVREGPGKEYRILDRSELAPDDYAQSVDSTTTTDALMEKGSVITCLEMSGNWMRISSGWVCVEDEGEVLVK